jgi:hypothetical protein
MGMFSELKQQDQADQATALKQARPQRTDAPTPPPAPTLARPARRRSHATPPAPRPALPAAPLPTAPPPVPAPALPPTDSVFDLTEPAYRNDTFVFTDAELEALEDMKLELRRKYDIARATKQNLIRCALHMLLEDFQREKETCFAVKRLRSKRR